MYDKKENEKDNTLTLTTLTDNEDKEIKVSKNQPDGTYKDNYFKKLEMDTKEKDKTMIGHYKNEESVRNTTTTYKNCEMCRIN